MTRPNPTEADRIAIGAAFIRCGFYDDDEMDLLQWHPCPDCYRPDGPRRGKCGCSGVPYISDEVWRELGPVIAAIRATSDGRPPDARRPPPTPGGVMKKIPTLFRRDPDDMRRVTREVHPDCQWVLDGEGVATRKYDGTCVALDSDGWWARREVKPGKTPPPNFQPVMTDEATGKTVGWEPVNQSAYFRWFREAFESDPRHEGIGGGYPHGTYELCGPKINGNPENFTRHLLVRHDAAERFSAPRDFDDLAAFLADFEGEGIVWHHPDGRMAKLKRRDFPAEETA